MFKKLISLICCLLPVGAGAVVESFSSEDDVYTTSSAWQDAMRDNETIRINKANGIDDVWVNATDFGLVFSNGMYVGQADVVNEDLEQQTDALYIMSGANTAKDFSVSTIKDVSIGTVLGVLDGWTLNVNGVKDTDGSLRGQLLIGTESEAAYINVESGAALNVINLQSVKMNGGMNIDGTANMVAGTVDADVINVNSGGVATIETIDGDLTFGSLVSDVDSVTTINSSANISAGMMQNGHDAGDMKITSVGNVTIAGNLENSGSLLSVVATDVLVQGAVKNDSLGSNLSVVSRNLTINGDGDTVSLFNRGNFEATVDNETTFVKGFLIDGGAGSTFSLKTGTVDLGTTTDLLSSLKSFNLEVTSGALSVGAIENSGQNMTLDIALGLTADYVSAVSGVLEVDSAQVTLGDDVTKTALDVSSGAVLSIDASTGLNVVGAISNRGTATLNAQNVELAAVSNMGADSSLNIGSSTSSLGVVKIGGNLGNDAGSVTVHAKDIEIAGQLSVSNAGTTNIIGSDSGSDSMIIHGINVDNSTLGLTVLSRNLDVIGDMSVKNAGVVNLDSSVASVDVAGDFSLNGNLNIGANIFALSANSVNITGNWNFAESDKTVQLVSDDIDISGNVFVADSSKLIFGDVDTVSGSELDIAGTVGGDNSTGMITIFSDVVSVGAINHAGLMRLYGDGIVAKTGSINIGGIVRFDSSLTNYSGLSLMGDSFTLQTDGKDAGIATGDVQVAANKILSMKSVAGITSMNVSNYGNLSVYAGNVSVNNIKNYNQLNFNSGSIKTANVDNYAGGNIELFANSSVETAAVTNFGLLTILNKDGVSAVNNVKFTGDILNQSGGTIDVIFNQLSAQNINVMGGNIDLNAVGSGNLSVAAADVTVNGDFVQGAQSGALNLLGVKQFTAQNLSVSGNFDAVAGNTQYYLSDSDIKGALSVSENATVKYDASGVFASLDIVNSGSADISAKGGVVVKNKILNTGGVLSINSDNNYISANSVDVSKGYVSATGEGFNVNNAFVVNGVLGQGASSAMMNILSDSYTINTGIFNVGGISQSGKLNINSSDITVSGNIVASDLTISANPAINRISIFVDGSVSGGVDFIGLEKMQITGDYIFDNNSSLLAAILPYASGTGANTTDVNYWATVSPSVGVEFGQVVNAPDANPLIAVGGKFSSDLTFGDFVTADGSSLDNAQIGIKIFDMIDNGTAIWLLHADGGVYDVSDKITNINVKFCNEDASVCFAYLNDLDPESDGVPAYISVRDTDGDDTSDSLYIVFDDNLINVSALFPIQPIVADVPMHKDYEYFAAGAIDSVIAGRLQANKFYNETPLEVLNVLFQGTNMELTMKELYNRMADYVINENGSILSSFIRLFEGTDGEQAAGMMALNEHTTFRSFEDRMVDEFIWNRNRRLDKAWMDVDYGMFYQNTLSGNHTDGNRFAISGGFDWQESDTLILGLTGHISHSASSVGDVFDLSYASVSQMGHLDTNVTDTNLGFGGYLMKTLGDKARLYGNAFVDAHLFDVERNQTFVDTIDGDGTAFSLISEFGLLHDILNQYIVGNVYARVGYNFGLNISSDAAGSEFMKYKQDGYFMLTPGYSLTAQKRIYPTAWLQIRPYATIGIEYDVLGMKDSIEYKFAGATNYSPYDINVEPLWANIGGGFEMLSANGLQFGLDYRYQYNQEMQLHNIRFTGMYRF